MSYGEAREEGRMGKQLVSSLLFFISVFNRVIYVTSLLMYLEVEALLVMEMVIWF